MSGFNIDMNPSLLGGGASKVNGPMGNKFFLKTGAKCKDTQSGKKVDRFMYVNNVPDGQIRKDSPLFRFALLI